ncbi:MAG TPA: MBOAT family protein, partial [Acidisoma sp.]|nr:MBOAT family protein [Acidisoma sp.]
MLFGTPLFLLGFLPLTLAGFRLTARIGTVPALGLLLCANFIFYGFGDRADSLLLAASILGNWLILPRMASGAWFAAGIAANLAVLGLFKYGGLIAASLGLPALGLALPLGISFFTFQQIMVLRDARIAPPARNAGSFLAYANCISFFAHLIAGPLVHPAEIMPQIQRSLERLLDPEAIAEGLMRILLGLAKKLVLADSFAPLADRGFAAAAHGAPLSLFEAWVALLAFGL